MKRFNWQIWAGFLLSLIASFSYPFLFINWAVTRDFPWVNFLLYALALVFLFLGIRRAFTPGKRTITKIASSIAAALGVLLLGLFIFSYFFVGKWLPASTNAPQIGAKAPDFTLPDTNNKPVSLTELLTQPINNKPPKGVLLIFYRGYW
jgi:hypothetical protein